MYDMIGSVPVNFRKETAVAPNMTSDVALWSRDQLFPILSLRVLLFFSHKSSQLQK